MNTLLLKLEPMTQMMLRQQIKDSQPNTFVAYLIWLLLGWLGGHHYYLAIRSSGDTRTVFLCLGLLYTFTLGLSFVGWMFDLFGTGFYSQLVKKNNEDTIVNDYLKANGLGGKVTPSEVAKNVSSYSLPVNKGGKV